MPKCPSCDKILTNVCLKQTDIREPFSLGGGWRGVIYFCPWCSHALGTVIDQVSLKADTVSEISDELDVLKNQMSQIGNLLNQIVHRLNQMH